VGKVSQKAIATSVDKSA